MPAGEVLPVGPGRGRDARRGETGAGHAGETKFTVGHAPVARSNRCVILERARVRPRGMIPEPGYPIRLALWGAILKPLEVCA
ncbi:MAG: hypothetical protein AMXMBFR47_35000 [Planctomycetota bacterium]